MSTIRRGALAAVIPENMGNYEPEGSTTTSRGWCPTCWPPVSAILR